MLIVSPLPDGKTRLSFCTGATLPDQFEDKFQFLTEFAPVHVRVAAFAAKPVSVIAMPNTKIGGVDLPLSENVFIDDLHCGSTIEPHLD